MRSMSLPATPSIEILDDPTTTNPPAVLVSTSSSMACNSTSMACSSTSLKDSAKTSSSAAPFMIPWQNTWQSPPDKVTKEEFQTFCCTFLQHVRQSSQLAKKNKSSRASRGRSPKVQALTTEQLKDDCRKLYECCSQGLRHFSEFVKGESLIAWTLSQLVERILELKICQEALIADPLFAKNMGRLRFDAAEMDQQIEDIRTVFQMFRETIAIRRDLIDLLEQYYASKCKTAVARLGLDNLSERHISDELVNEFYEKLGLSTHLESVNLEGKRSIISLLIQSPYRIPFAVNHFIQFLPDALNRHYDDLDDRLNALIKMRDNPQECLNEKSWISLLDDMVQIGKDKELIARAMKELIARSITKLARDGKITQMDRRQLLKMLSNTQPGYALKTNWSSFAPLISEMMRRANLQALPLSRT